VEKKLLHQKGISAKIKKRRIKLKYKKDKKSGFTLIKG